MVITNPELLMRPGNNGFARLLRDPKFMAKILSIVSDEAHCISQWGFFRPEFRETGRLPTLLEDIPVHITSATLPDHVLTDVLNTVNIRKDELYTMHRSNDRPNVFIAVRKLQHPQSSFADLDFLVGDWAAGKAKPRKFLVMFDSINDCVLAGKRLCDRLPMHLKNKVLWHHSNMTAEFRAEELEALMRGDIIGFCATDTLGIVSKKTPRIVYMHSNIILQGMDICDFGIVVQYGVCKLTMSTLAQRKGRATRDPNIEAIFLVLAEKKYFERNRRKAAEKTTRKRKASSSGCPPQKRQCLAGSEQIYPGVSDQGSATEINTESGEQSMSFEDLLLSRR